ncbi:MAG: putative porin [Acidobacteriota bacterium]
MWNAFRLAPPLRLHITLAWLLFAAPYLSTDILAADGGAEIKELKALVEEQRLMIQDLSAQVSKQQRVLDQLLSGVNQPTPTTAEKEPATTASVLQSGSPADAALVPAGGAQEIAARTESPARKDSSDMAWGGLKFSGDFRIRFDVIERAAGASLGAVHNVRGRYRFRWNTDKDLSPNTKLHFQLSTGPFQNGLTNDQDMSGVISKHPFSLAEAYIDHRMTPNLSFRVGRMENIFADQSRFLFDDDTRLSGIAERWTLPVRTGPIQNFELRAAQYNLTNPTVAVIQPESPLAKAGFAVGSQARSSQLFHQGVSLNNTIKGGFNQHWQMDLQVYRNANQLALAGTPDGVALLVSPVLGLTLPSPISGRGSAVANPEGTMFAASAFRILHFKHELQAPHIRLADREMPLIFGIQLSRNIGTSRYRDAFMGSVEFGQVEKAGDLRFLYFYALKDANSMISYLTDDNVGIGSGVNVTSHHVRVDYGLAKRVTLQNLFFFQHPLRGSNPAENFLVSVPRGTPTLFRYRGQIEFKF